jgi:hypothetical protein
MKKTVLAGVAALLMATFIARADNDEIEYNCGSNDDEITLKHEHLLSDLARTTITRKLFTAIAQK